MRSRVFTPILGMLTIGYTLLALFYVFVIPLWQGADEPTHFEQVLLTGQSGILSRVPPPRIDKDIQARILETFDVHRFWHYVGTNGVQPPPTQFVETPFLRLVPTQRSKPLLYYRIAALTLMLYPDADIQVQVYMLRVLGVLLSLAGVYALWTIGLRICEGERERVLLCTASALFLPQFLITTTTISNEALFLPLYFLFLAVLFSEEVLSKRVYILLIIMLSAACIFTDRMGFLTLPMVLFHHRHLLRYLAIFGRPLLYSFAALLLVSPIVTWHSPAFIYRVVNRMTMLYLKLPFGQFVGEHQMIPLHNFLSTLAGSFVCAPGWMRFSLDGTALTVIFSVYVLGLLGWILAFVTGGRGQGWQLLGLRPYPMISLLFNVVMILTVIMTGYYGRGFYAQGRFLFPVLWPVMAIGVVGLLCVLRYLGVKASDRLLVIFTLLVLLQAHSLFTVVLPVFVMR